MVRVLFCFLLTLMVQGGVFSLPAQKLLYPGDSLYDALTALSMEQRLIFLSGSVMTVAQAELMLAKINDEELSPGGKVLYEQARAALARPSLLSRNNGLFAFDFSPGVQPEVYYKTNDKLPWIYGRNSRQPLIPLPVTLSISSYITAEADLYLGENRQFSRVNNNYINIPFETSAEGVDAIDVNTPTRAYVSAGFSFGQGFGMNFKLGLGDDSLGRTKTGSIILSDNMRGFSYGSLTIYAPFLSYTASVMELEVTKYLYLHHLQVAILNRLSLSLIGGAMVNAPLELRYLNPMMVFHSFSAWNSYGDYNDQMGNPEDLTPWDSRVGSYMGISVDYRPWKYGRFYALGAMNEFELSGEGGEDSRTPNGLAFQWGYESWLPVSGEGRTGYVTFGLEGVYTFPYMYILGNKAWSYYREVPEDPRYREWVGTPFGPDSAAAIFWVGYHNSSRWSAELSFLFLAQGENATTDVFSGNTYRPQSRAETVATTPTGTAAYTYLIKTRGAWEVKKWLDLSVQPAYKIVANYGHIAGNLQHGFEVAFTARIIPDIGLLRKNKDHRRLTGSTSTSR
ncbi:hypothetical protein AGMMS49587_08220 [Spirochaetia bacterium]|nr:hypothetical protein AGMMS49587_08220 [Spirochaetia bacterium]